MENQCHDIDKYRSKYLETHPYQFHISHFEWSGIKHGPAGRHVTQLYRAWLACDGYVFQEQVVAWLYLLTFRLLSSLLQ